MSHFCVRKFSWKSVSCARDSFGTRTHTHTNTRHGTKRCYSRILFCINKDSSGSARGRGEVAKNMQIHLRSGPKDISDDNLPAWVQLHIRLQVCTCVCVCVLLCSGLCSFEFHICIPNVNCSSSKSCHRSSSSTTSTWTLTTNRFNRRRSH